MTADVGVAMPGLVVIGCPGAALVVNLSAGISMNDVAGLSRAALSVNGNHAPVALVRNNGVAADVGVAAPGLGMLGAVGSSIMDKVSPGSSVNDCAGSSGTMLSLNGVHSAVSFNRCNGSVINVGVAIPGNGLIGTAGVASVINLSAGA